LMSTKTKMPQEKDNRNVSVPSVGRRPRYH
jgi:hypothetical protein